MCYSYLPLCKSGDSQACRFHQPIWADMLEISLFYSLLARFNFVSRGVCCACEVGIVLSVYCLHTRPYRPVAFAGPHWTVAYHWIAYACMGLAWKPACCAQVQPLLRNIAQDSTYSLQFSPGRKIHFWIITHLESSPVSGEVFKISGWISTHMNVLQFYVMFTLLCPLLCQ